ncbi:MAG TPA: ABC transporter substrate-binding protein [Actinomycetes bacterium]|jgi:polar amino acid transport system substrate-binding protein|nr:ABC transporter substrate-binding protein [Actinomycetes bacterium]
MVGSRRGHGTLLAMVASMGLLLAACGGGGNEGGSSGGGGGLTDLGKKLPSAIQQSKEIKAGSDIAYAPVEFYKEGTQQVQGIDWDLAQALGQKLGVKFTFANTTFDGIIPALKAKRFDIIMSAMSDTPERQKEVDFIDYFRAGTSILVKKGNPQNIQSLDDLCGKTIALQKGTTQVDVANEQQGKCTSAGKPKINILTYDKDTDAQLQLRTGRAVADMNDFPVAAYAAQTVGGGNDFQVVGEQIGAGPYGIGVRKDDTQLRDTLQEALKAVIADGTYARILQKWNVSQGALTTADINGGQ